jgi:plasmid maintenance system antidote protein VapI
MGRGFTVAPFLKTDTMTPKELKNIRQETILIIKDFCEQTGTSYTALALASGIHPAQLLKFVRGEQGLTTTTLEKIGDHIEKRRYAKRK